MRASDLPKTFIHIHSFGHILVFSTFAQLYIYHILNMCSKSHCAFWSTLSFELPALTTESLISMQSRSFSLRKEEKQRVENKKLSCLKKFPHQLHLLQWKPNFTLKMERPRGSVGRSRRGSNGGGCQFWEIQSERWVGDYYHLSGTVRDRRGRLHHKYIKYIKNMIE